MSYAQGLGQDEFMSSDMIHDATLWNLVLIGEAASNVPALVMASHSEIPWREIVVLQLHY